MESTAPRGVYTLEQYVHDMLSQVPDVTALSFAATREQTIAAMRAWVEKAETPPYDAA